MRARLVLAPESEQGLGDVGVHLGAICGPKGERGLELDQGGGVVWRAANAKNYYLCRYNPLEANIRVYKVVNGERIIIHSVENVEEKEGWQTMRVVTNGTRHEGHLNDQVRFSILEETFQEAGKVGLWSKADAQTHFDDLELEVMDR